MDDSFDESDSSDSAWEAVEEPQEVMHEETVCLFCPDKLASPEAIFEHCHYQHGFDIIAFGQKNSLNAISYIKLINFIRLKGCSVVGLLNLPANDASWSSDDYMKPTFPDDPLLMFDIESYLEDRCKCNRKDDIVSLPRSQFEDLLQKLAAKELQLQNAMADIEKMRMTAQNVLLAPDINSDDNDSYEGESYFQRDEAYFNTYDHFGIHHEMLQDHVRTETYRSAILDNKELFKGKVVLDVGCGTAILSMFAAIAGAKRVWGVDQSDIIYQAMDIIRENGLDGSVYLHKDKLEDSELPFKKVDVIVSEWMGYFLLYEGMLDTVIYARDKYLTSDGLMLPDKCTLSLVAVNDLELQKNYVNFWDDVYGFRMSCMKTEAIKEAGVELVEAEKICSHPVIVKELDLMTCTINDCNFLSNFVMEFTKDCHVTALVGYFDCFFERNLNKKVHFSTSPTSKPTHWKQTIFLLSPPLSVFKGQNIEGNILCERRFHRSLSVTLTLGSRRQTFLVH